MAKVTSMNDEQIQAVEARNSHILVSAPAGSGKTKILVSRILSILKEGVNIDSFLVLTFTQAAAKEMKQRLSSMLDEEIAIASGDLKDHLMKQKERMPLAYITNFHGFCNSLIQHYGYLVGVQPGYDILSDNKGLLSEALSLALDDLLLDDEFATMRFTYFKQREDLEKQILRIYEILQAVGDKQQFLDYMMNDVYGFLENQGDRDLSDWCFYPQLLSQLEKVVVQVLVEIEELKQFCITNGLEAFYQRPDGQKGKALEKPVPYEALYDYYFELYHRISSRVAFKGSGGLNEWAIQKPAATYNMPWKDYGDDIEDIKKKFNAMKTALNGRFNKVYDKLVDSDVENTMLVHQEAKRVIALLVGAVEQVTHHYQQLKTKQSVLDFNDLEKYATKLLQKEYPIARELNEKLYEIMVDEYQDTNMVQETIVSLISKATDKEVYCFMVGDMKQSIYRFRQADPEIFKQKFDTYPINDGCMRIDLGFNYRSSKVVLDSINYIFNQVMDEHIGSLEYYKDPSAQLNYDFLRKEGAKDTSEFEMVRRATLERLANMKKDKTEVLMVNTSSEKVKDIEDSEYEAMMIAHRIQELIKEPLNGKTLTYSDCAVLMRQTTRFMTYKKVFDKMNIPTTIVLSTGFMNATEIRQMMMMYRCLKDPYDDLALMSVLRAPFNFSYFSENDIVAVRNPEYSLYENICGSEKFNHFVSTLEELKVQLKHLPFSRWHDAFFEVSGYLNRGAVMKNGVQRYQNLLLLVEKIKEKENVIFDIASWVDYFESIQESAIAPASMPKDQDAVVFMTIHKSKGLEFPVCFVAMHDKNFNLQDGKERLIFDRHLTMAIKPRLLQTYEKILFNQPMTYQDVVVEYANPFLNLLSLLANQETISEEMRVYYVALTRAKSKLILTGCMDEDTLRQYVQDMRVDLVGNVPEKDEWIFNRKIRDGRCYLDWLMPSVIRHPMILPTILDTLSLPNNYLQPLSPNLENTNQAKFEFKWPSYQEIDEYLPKSKESPTVVENDVLFDQNDYAYERYLHHSIAVTTLEKLQASDEPTYTTTIPTQPQRLSAAQKGTLVHEFMEYLPLVDDVSIKNVIELLYNEKRYTEDEYIVLCEYEDKLNTFVNSEAFQMMKQAEQCLCEQPFCFMKDGQLIHGTIDVLCINNDTVSIIDYKTDRVSKYAKEEDLIARHAFQLNLYKEALQTIYPKQTIEAYLYYLQTSRFVKV